MAIDRPEIRVVLEFLRTSFEATCIVDKDGKILFLNDSFEKFGHRASLERLLASDHGKNIVHRGLRLTKFVPFSIDCDGLRQQAKIRRLVPDPDLEIGIIVLHNSKRISTTTSNWRHSRSISREKFLSRLAAERLNAFCLQTRDGIGLLNSEGCIVATNPALCNLLGVSSETQLFGKAFDELSAFQGKLGAVFDKAGHEITLSESAGDPLALYLLRGDREIPVEISVTAWRNLRRLEFFVVVRNLSDAHQLAKIEKLNEKLLAAQKTKDDFIQLVSHEMRTPLAAIVSASENLQKESELCPEISRNAQIVEQSARDALTQFSSILSMSKEKPDTATMMSLAELRDQLLRYHRPIAERGGVKLVGQISDEIDVSVDARRVFLIATNLVSNALKHAPGNGVVKFSLSIPSGENFLEIRVDDNGPGIPKDKQSSIFQAFETGVDQMDILGGLGVGLALVKAAVDDLGGEISFSSKPDQGTHFVVLIPFAKSAAVESIHVESDFRISLTMNDAVLIVDDDKINREVLSSKLRRLGFPVQTAINGQEAVDVIRAASDAPIKLVLMDNNMALLDGIGATQAIRHLKLTEQPAICGLTARLDDDIREKMLNAGMDHVLEKPLTDQKLRAIVRRVSSVPEIANGIEVHKEVIARSILKRDIPKVLVLAENHKFGDAARTCARISAALASVGLRKEAAFLRNIALRLNDALPLDREEKDRLLELLDSIPHCPEASSLNSS